VIGFHFEELTENWNGVGPLQLEGIQPVKSEKGKLNGVHFSQNYSAIEII
jgi:hypothetical protein